MMGWRLGWGPPRCLCPMQLLPSLRTAQGFENGEPRSEHAVSMQLPCAMALHVKRACRTWAVKTPLVQMSMPCTMPCNLVLLRQLQTAELSQAPRTTRCPTLVFGNGKLDAQTTALKQPIRADLLSTFVRASFSGVAAFRAVPAWPALNWRD